MAEDANVERSTPPAGEAPKTEGKKKRVERTVLRPYPKVIFFYLTWIAALVCGIITALYSDSEHAAAVQRTWTWVFLWVFTFNLLVVSFEFSRMLSVALLFLGLALLFLGLLLHFWGKVFGFLADIHPQADHHFFFFIFFVFTVIYALIFLQTRFNYWVVRRNELLHKHGFLGDVKRYQAQHVKMDKEISDVFEYLLLRSGTIIFHVAEEKRAIVLENIIGINRKEDEVKQILESYAVRLEKE